MLKRFYYMVAYIYMNKNFNKNHTVYQRHITMYFYEKHDRYNTPDLLKGKNRSTEYTYKK